MLKRETRLLAALARENLEQSHIVHFFESFRDQEYQHMVFEVLDKNLYQFQADIGFKSLSIRDIRTITFQVLTALSKLKAIGIVHADIKPENVMLVDQSQHPFRVKLIDFGSSYTIDEADALRVSYLQTRYYRAPEIVLGLPFCEKMDIWSLGCMAAELYLGHPLYPANSELELLHYMCETLGMLPTSLLNSASKAKYFFDLVKRRVGESQWKLKPTQQRLSLTGRRSLRRHVVTSLAHLEKGVPVAGFGREDAVEVFDRWCMVDLLKRMLTLDARSRIDAGQALRHPFVTLQHLRASDGYRQYYDSSLRGYREALIPRQPSPDVPDRTLAPPREKRSLRSSLRSFFARLCVLKRRRKPVGPRPASDHMKGQPALPGPQAKEDSAEGFGAAEKGHESPPAGTVASTSQATCDEEPAPLSWSP
ncbi:homeodomain-interacting protein kinase 4-like isoform X1 [Anguilla anguilla]|uniref:homeodomain-interacting protein kinase 4-like isoform X1 n=2 Tax=Anguilla anguilla TaxID=7936 RepID=UPI0015AAE653|nr:homeodomain-interacting protein kinase 4-like isoform X1 [Anguilla anguilla]